mgnify:CR=1 FL=1
MPENDAPTETDATPQNIDWLTIPEIAEAIGETAGRVRRLLDEHYLIGTRRNGPISVPALFIVDGAPLGSLRGTIIALQDAGFADDEVIDWLFAEEETLGRTPIAALLDGHKSAVRRVARALA